MDIGVGARDVFPTMIWIAAIDNSGLEEEFGDDHKRREKEMFSFRIML